MNILFSESELFYEQLGLQKCRGLNYFFDGMRLYKKKSSYFRQYDLFVCAFYTMPHNVLITQKCQQENICTVLCTDGIFEFSNAMTNPMITKYQMKLYHPILQDFLLCVGTREAQYFESFTPSFSFLPKRVISSDKLIPLPLEKRILVTTANTAYYNESEFLALSNLLIEIIVVLKNSNVKFDLRIFDNKILAKIREVSGNVRNITQDSFENILCQYSSVITTPSSIVIPSMYHQRSVCQLIYRDFPVFLQTGWNVTNGDLFKESLTGIVNCEQVRIDIQNRILLSYINVPSLSESLKKIINIHSINREEKISYINNSYANMLNSFFNFNVEYFVRKIYNKNKRLFKKLRHKIR